MLFKGKKYTLAEKEVELEVGEREVIIVLTNGEEHTIVRQGKAEPYERLRLHNNEKDNEYLKNWVGYPEYLRPRVFHIRDVDIIREYETMKQSWFPIKADNSLFVNRDMIAKIKLGPITEKKIKVIEQSVVEIEEV